MEKSLCKALLEKWSVACSRKGKKNLWLECITALHWSPWPTVHAFGCAKDFVQWNTLENTSMVTIRVWDWHVKWSQWINSPVDVHKPELIWNPHLCPSGHSRRPTGKGKWMHWQSHLKWGFWAMPTSRWDTTQTGCDHNQVRNDTWSKVYVLFLSPDRAWGLTVTEHFIGARREFSPWAYWFFFFFFFWLQHISTPSGELQKLLERLLYMG